MLILLYISRTIMNQSKKWQKSWHSHSRNVDFRSKCTFKYFLGQNFIFSWSGHLSQFLFFSFKFKIFFLYIQAFYVQNTIPNYVYTVNTQIALLAPPLKPNLWVFELSVRLGVIGVEWCHVVGGPIISALRGELFISECCFTGAE